MSKNDMLMVPRELRSVLSMILNALDRDASEGKAARGEMAEELRAILGRPSDHHQGEPVAWSPVKPVSPGAYWIRGNGLDREALVQIINDGGELRCNLHQRTTETDFGYGYAVSDLSEEFEWLGPLHSSADPGEVERLREEIKHLRDGWYKDESDNSRYWPEQLQEAKSELAERDALLQDLLDYDISKSARRRIEEALSIIAELKVKS